MTIGTIWRWDQPDDVRNWSVIIRVLPLTTVGFVIQKALDDGWTRKGVKVTYSVRISCRFLTVILLKWKVMIALKLFRYPTDIFTKAR